MPKRAYQSPRRPNLKRRPTLQEPAWNTVGAIVGPLNPISSERAALVAPALELIWHKRLRWYETVLMLANRLNIAYPGIRDVFHAVILPRMIKPCVALSARFALDAIYSFMDGTVFPCDSGAVRYLSSDVDPAPRRQDWRVILDEMRIEEFHRIRHFIEPIAAIFDVFESDEWRVLEVYDGTEMDHHHRHRVDTLTRAV